jgi:hypothetical protein
MQERLYAAIFSRPLRLSRGEPAPTMVAPNRRWRLVFALVMTKQRPVSGYVQVRGLYLFARLLDKIRKHARGELHENHVPFLGKGFDERLCHFMRVDYEELRARTLAGGSDEEIFDWCQQTGRGLKDIDVLMWNGFVSKRGWRDETTPALEADKAKRGLAHRTDIVTFFEFYEVDEGRAPR